MFDRVTEIDEPLWDPARISELEDALLEASTAAESENKKIQDLENQENLEIQSLEFALFEKTKDFEEKEREFLNKSEALEVSHIPIFSKMRDTMDPGIDSNLFLVTLYLCDWIQIYF